MVNSDRGGEDYGRCDEIGRNPEPFTKYLQECGIDAQYIMCSDPRARSDPNGESEPKTWGRPFNSFYFLFY